MWKIIKNFIILLFVAILIFTIQYNFKYNIKSNEEKIVARIEAMYNTTVSDFNNLKIDDLEIKKRLDIDNKTFIYCSSEKISITGELEKGLNGKYKINGIGSGPNIFEYRIEETKEGEYFVLFGKNFDMKISHVEARIDKKKYKIKVPKEEIFIVYCTLPQKTMSRFPEEFRIYNDVNVDITLETMHRSYNK